MSKEITVRLNLRELDAILDALYWQSVEIQYDDRECARKMYKYLKDRRKEIAR